MLGLLDRGGRSRLLTFERVSDFPLPLRHQKSVSVFLLAYNSSQDEGNITRGSSAEGGSINRNIYGDSAFDADICFNIDEYPFAEVNGSISAVAGFIHRHFMLATAKHLSAVPISFATKERNSDQIIRVFAMTGPNSPSVLTVFAFLRFPALGFDMILISTSKSLCRGRDNELGPELES